MQNLDPVQFAQTRAQVADWITADRAFDLMYHLCDALHQHRFLDTSRVLEDALDTYLAEAKRVRPSPVIEGHACAPEAGARLRRAIENMHMLEARFDTVR